MRVLVISHIPFDNNDYKGGNWVKAFANTLAAEEDFSVAVTYVSQLKKEKWEENGIHFYPIFRQHSVGDRIRRIILRKPSVVYDGRIDDIVAEFNPDIIQLFGLETEIAGIVGHISEIPVIVHLQGIISECIKTMYPNGIDPKAFRSSYPMIDRILRRTYYDETRLAIKRAKREQYYFMKYKYFFGRTDWDREKCLEYSPEARYFLCNELIRPEFYCRKWSLRDDGVVLTSVFNCEAYKGFDTILKTSRMLKEQGFKFEWNIYGVAEDSIMPRTFEKQLGIKFSENNVHLRGTASAEELSEAFIGSTLFIHASHIDNSPNAVCEAMVVGLPVIAMNVGGLSSIVENGKSGALVDDYDIAGLARRITELSCDKDLLSSISEEEIKSSHDRHSRENITAGLRESYSRIMDDEKKRLYD